MLIIEGTDSVGKTTLAKALGEELNLLYQHLGPLPSTWCEQDYIKLGCNKCVYDRFHVSELAYSYALARQCKIHNARFLHSALTIRFAALTVIITAEPDLIELRHRDADQMFDLQSVLKVNKYYERLAPHYADVYYHATAAMPFVPEEIKTIIKNKWRTRQSCQQEWIDTLKSSM